MIDYASRYLANAVMYRGLAQRCRIPALKRHFGECMRFWAVLAVKIKTTKRQYDSRTDNSRAA
jgi:hypothetical protein